MMDSCRRNGYSLAELLVTVAIVGVLAAMAAAAYRALLARASLRLAANQVFKAMRSTQARAIAEERNVAVKFRQENGRWTYAIYGDGDGDGVRNQDITAGVDRLVMTAALPSGGVGGARIGLPPYSVRDPGGRALAPGQSPVRFNGSTLCSFSPVGNATAGSLFLTNGTEVMTIIVTGETGAMRILRWNRSTHRWTAP